jgi:hypothetical protein
MIVTLLGIGVVGVFLCAILLVNLLRQGYRIERMVEIQLAGLDESYRLAYDAFQADLGRLEARVRSLEAFSPPLQTFTPRERRQ